MNPTVERLKLIFLGIFVLTLLVLAVWQVGWIAPRQKCDQIQGWWDGSHRVCAQPILTSDITGRVITDQKALAEAKAAIGRGPAPAPAAKP